MSVLVEYLLIILGVLVLLLVRFFIGREFCAAAEAKGYTGDKYLWWIMFTGIPGMLLVIALPDRGADTADMDDTVPAQVPQKTERTHLSSLKKNSDSKPAIAKNHSGSRSTLEAQDVDSLPHL